MNKDIKESVPEIKDKFDTDSAEQLVLIGYPENAERLPDLIFWSCWPNDPVCWITHPYIYSLRDEILAPPMAEFLEFNLAQAQNNLIEDAFWLFINERGEHFRTLVRSHVKSPEGNALFMLEKYSLEEYKSQRERFEQIRNNTGHENK